ncbi:ATP-grasp fold amidoligase family protein [Avibacterium gallinarum]|uniref:ATP-grasp fold amidoligase family protein n=1 Tax=Avibacterium gallinarum TaxID=755 RepID=UPI003BF7DB41
MNLNKIRYSQLLEMRIQRKEKNVPWNVMPKKGTKNFCQAIGANIVQVLQEFDSIESIRFNNLPDFFVLKPENGHSNAGVLILERKSPGVFYEAFTKKIFSVDDIKQKIKDNLNKFNISHSTRYIAEEYIPDIYGELIPHDFKFFIFQGEIGIIMEVDRNSPTSQTYSFYEPDFSPVTPGRVIGLKEDVKITLKSTPEFSKNLINLAKRVSIALPTPFARIDLYYDGNHAKVGEITLTPYYGYPYKWSDAQDTIMGRMWYDAILRMNKKTEDFFDLSHE